VQGPDASIPPTRTRYMLGSLGQIAATTDSNGHKVERESDEFGRLRVRAHDIVGKKSSRHRGHPN
jgi:hypothetical protein